MSRSAKLLTSLVLVRNVGQNVVERRRCAMVTSVRSYASFRPYAPFRPYASFRSYASERKEEKEEVVDGRRFFPRRCVMYVPGDNEKMLAKSVTMNSDSLVFDCEDGVAGNRKEDARKSILSFIQGLNTSSNDTEYAVRINSVASGLAEDDLKTVLSGEKIPHSIYLPKVDTVKDIDWFAETLGHVMPKEHKDINLVIYAESAKSLINLKDICARTLELSEYHLFHLDGIVFGSDDYIASVGATRSKDASEVLVARQTVVMTAKAFGIEAIDVVYIDYKDIEGLRDQCMDGAKMGFTGKQCIHPGQIETIHRCFTPSTEKITWARQLVAEFKQHSLSGKGAFVFQGSMIDKPLLLQAENIIRIADRVKA